MKRLFRWFIAKIRSIFGLSRPAQELPKPRETLQKKRPRWFWGFGTNMPRKQPCLKCRAWSRRVKKETSGDVAGAIYRCRTHGVWFVPSR